MRRKSITVLTTAALLTACGGSQAGGPSKPRPNSPPSAGQTRKGGPSGASGQAPLRATTIVISNYAYHPPSITVTQGAKVTFVNHDPTAHTATSSRPSFDSGTLRPEQHRTLTFNKPGTFTYYCQFHPFMRAVITVKPPS